MLRRHWFLDDLFLRWMMHSAPFLSFPQLPKALKLPINLTALRKGKSGEKIYVAEIPSSWNMYCNIWNYWEQCEFFFMNYVLYHLELLGAMDQWWGRDQGERKAWWKRISPLVLPAFQWLSTTNKPIDKHLHSCQSAMEFLVRHGQQLVWHGNNTMDWLH